MNWFDNVSSDCDQPIAAACLMHGHWRHQRNPFTAPVLCRVVLDVAEPRVVAAQVIDELADAAEHVLGALRVPEIVDQLVVDRQVRRQHEEIVDAVRQVQREGYCVAAGTFNADTHSVAVPFPLDDGTVLAGSAVVRNTASCGPPGSSTGREN